MDEVKKISDLTCFIGFLGAMLLSWLASWVNTKYSVKKVLKENPDLKILHVLKSQFTLTIVFGGLGGFFGGFVLPFFIFEDLERIKMFTQSSAIYYMCLCLFALPVGLSLLLYTVILTDKKIITKSVVPLKITMLLNREILIKDIKEIKMFPAGQINFILKSGEVYGIGAYRTSKKFYEKLTNLLEIEKNKGGG